MGMISLTSTSLTCAISLVTLVMLKAPEYCVKIFNELNKEDEQKGKDKEGRLLAVYCHLNMFFVTFSHKRLQDCSIIATIAITTI